jgi:hypothetical protein
VAGRYDGIDFADETSRLAVFPSPPYGVDPFDEFMTANFGRASYLNARIAERLTQAMGRMTRGESDWAVVVLESADIAHTLVRRDVSMYLPDDLWADLEDAFDRLDTGFVASLDLAEAILRGAPISARTSRERPRAERPGWTDELADLEASYGDALFSGTYDGAIPAATALLDRLGEHPLRAWWLYLLGMAQYLSHLQDGRDARKQGAARSFQAAVRAAGRTSWLARVEASLGTLQTESAPAVRRNPISEFVAGFNSAAAFEGWKARTAASLRSAVHDEVAAGWTRVGHALGFAASQPAGQAATDVLWRSGSVSFVFEAKIEHAEGTLIARRDVNQLLGQMEQESLAGQTVYGSFLTHLQAYHPVAQEVVERISLVPTEVAYEVWRRAEGLLNDCWQAHAAGHDASRFQPPEGWLSAILELARGRVVTRSDLDHAWPHRP